MSYKPGPRQAVATCKHGVPLSIVCAECVAMKTDLVSQKPFQKCEHGVHVAGQCAKCNEELRNAMPPPGPMVVPGYQELARVLTEAFNQAARGKGKERHANDKPFTEQPIMQIANMVGTGGHAYQIMKKTQEAQGMVHKGDFNHAIHEMRGAIVYAAAMILFIEGLEK